MNKEFLLGLNTPLADSLEGLVALFNNDTVDWFAHLWDPEKGAFYYSNSGRDYEGFGPDLESTAQILRIVNYLGMIDGYGSLGNAIPPDICNGIIGFVNSLLSDDGYFYHPQWGKQVGISRRGRDLNCAKNIYKMLGVKPPRQTTLEILESKKKSNTVSAIPEYLKSKKAFLSYLYDLNIKDNSYASGNLIISQIDQIRAAGLSGCLCNYLDSIQNPDTGFGPMRSITDLYRDL